MQYVHSYVNILGETILSEYLWHSLKSLDLMTRLICVQQVGLFFSSVA